MNSTDAERTEGTPVPWWLVLLEGIAAAIIGILLLTVPGITLFALVQVTGFFWLIGGILAMVAAFATHRGSAGAGEARPA